MSVTCGVLQSGWLLTTVYALSFLALGTQQALGNDVAVRIANGTSVDCAAHPGVCDGMELARWFLSRKLVRVPKELAYFWPQHTHFNELVVCESERIVFAHVYKSAGTTVARTLQQICQRWAKLGSHERLPVKLFRGHPPPLVFTVVKEPLARLKSAVGEALRRNPPWWPEHEVPTTVSAGGLFEAMMGRGRSHLPRGYAPGERCFMDGHLRPQFAFLQHWGARFRLGFIGRVEDMGSVMEFIQLSLGLRQRPDPELRWSAIVHDKVVPALVINSTDMLTLCTLYWMDYAYFRYPLPGECAQNDPIVHAVQAVVDAAAQVPGPHGARLNGPRGEGRPLARQRPHVSRAMCGRPRARSRPQARRR